MAFKNWKKILLNYIVVAILFIILMLSIIPLYYNHIAVDDVSSFLFLTLLVFFLALWVTDCAVHYQLAALYKNQETRFLQGARQYMWRFLGFSILVGIIFIPVFVLMFPLLLPKQDNSSIIFIVPISLFMEMLFTIGKVSIVTYDYRVGSAISRAFKLIGKNIKYIFLMVISLKIAQFIVLFIGSSMTTQNNVIPISIILTLLNFAIYIWSKSMYTLIFFRVEKIPLSVLSDDSDMQDNAVITD